LRPDLPRELCETIDACLHRRPARRPSLEELGTAIEASLDGLPDRAPRAGAALGLRLGVAAAAATLGAWLAVGHGALLP
jgi:hypothetical protein